MIRVTGNEEDMRRIPIPSSAAKLLESFICLFLWGQAKDDDESNVGVVDASAKPTSGDHDPTIFLSPERGV